MTNFWAAMLVLTLTRQDFVLSFFYLKNLAKYGLDQEPVPKLFKSRNSIRPGIGMQVSTTLTERGIY